MSGKHYTRLEKQWLVENVDKYKSYKDLQKSFVELFGERSISSLRDVCSRRLRVHIVNTSGRYGERTKEQLPVGTERIVQGAVYIKVLEVPKGAKFSGYAPPYWLPKQRKVYEDHYGKIPKDCFVVFLDNNNRNFDINNLHCVNRSVLAIMNKNRWFTTDKEHTLTAIKWCELTRVLKG